MKIKLLAITPNSEQLIEYAGRVCWHTELSPTEEGTAKFIRSLIKRGHLSVIEHASATFEIDGVSRSCSHQLVRHRLASYSQESMRYVDMSTQAFKAPPSIIENDKALKSWLKAMDTAQETYQELRKLGITKQDSRFVLPIATTTRIVMTQNFRSWRHFIKLRCDRRSQWEIRELAGNILAILYGEAPAVFGDLYETFLE